MTGVTYEELVKLQAVRDLIAEHVGRLNTEINRWETIKKWALLERDRPSRAANSPLLKVKRAVVAERKKELLDSFYL